jgi:hypothetical protein
METMETLADIFKPWPSPEFEDLFGGIANRDLNVCARHAIALLRQRLYNLESALARRGLRLTVYNDLAVAHEDTLYALDTLDTYIQSIAADTPAPLEPRGAHIFAVYVVERFIDIAFYADELDHGSDSRPR